MDAYIQANRHRRVEDLALELSRRADLDAAFVLRQIEGWQRMRTKVPRWTEVEGIHYPPRLALEQCSGERAARYKAAVITRLIGTECGPGAAAIGKTTLCDLTGGMGVDFSFIAPGFDHATYVEQREELVVAARHNLPLLGLGKAEFVHGDGVAWLHDMSPVTVLFLDPARRDSHGGKTVLIEDCEPNVAELLPTLRAKSQWTVVKLSPMLDVHRAVTTLNAVVPGCVREVHVFAAGGECKDLLLVIGAPQNEEARIFCCEEDRVLDFTASEEATAPCPILGTADLAESQWLYEPGPAVMKAGAFRTVAARYGLRKLHVNSHLYVGAEPVEDFPGRAFAIERIYGFAKADLKALAADLKPAGGKANLTVRNFPATVADLRKKLKLREGGNAYLFATTVGEGTKVIVRCSKC